MPPEQFKEIINRFPKKKTIEEGASTSVWAAVAPELEDVGGNYLEDCQISKLSTLEAIEAENIAYMEYAVNLQNALKLWDLSLTWIKAK